MSLFPEDLRERDTGGMGGNFIKTAELEAGKLWKIGLVEIIMAKNPKYGANDKDTICTQGILKEGETIRYHLTGDDGIERLYESKGVAFYIAMRNMETNLNPGDVIRIRAEGTGESRRYFVEKIEANDEIVTS